MPRIDPLPRAKASPDAAAHYDRVFGPDRDPVAQPGTATGTPGNWHTVWAHTPAILKAFSAYPMAQSKLAPALREVALMRTGYVAESQFVYSQHCKGARNAGVSAEKIAAIPYWEIAKCFDDTERAILAYTDALLLQKGRVHGRVVDSLKLAIGEEGVLELSYFVKAFDMHAVNCRALRLEYDDVAERVVEVPAPETPKVQDWRDPRWSLDAERK